MNPRMLAHLAWRELRAGLKGFRLFMACIVLGVAGIAGIGSLAAASLAGISADARSLLGGDMEVRLAQRQASTEELAAFERWGKVSHVAELRAMGRAEGGGAPLLIEMKAVDDFYPLFGRLELSPQTPVSSALATGADGKFGAIAHPLLLQRMGLAVGDRVNVGEAVFEIRAQIEREPDSTTQVFAFGPHLIVSHEGLIATGLARPGSIIYHRYRLALADPSAAHAIADRINQAFPNAGWQIRHLEDAGQNVRQFIGNTRIYLDLIGLSALLIGGVGVANAVRAHLQSRARSIAILKCLGGTRGQVIVLHLLIVAAMSVPAIGLGVILGAAIPYALASSVGDLGLGMTPGLYAMPLLQAALFGALTAIVFSLPALLAASRTRPQQLLRVASVEIGAIAPIDRIATALAAAGLIGVVAALSNNAWLAFSYCIAAALALGAFRLLALALQHLARVSRERTMFSARALRFALSAVARREAPVASIVLAIGLGLTVLVSVTLIQASLQRDIAKNIPERAPSFYFIDIQPDQFEAFKMAALRFEGASEFQSVPMLRGRITKLAGVDAATITPPANLAWVLRGDRGITWAAAPPENADIVAGEWWPQDYRGDPLISLDAETAEGFGLKIGDEVAINVLGREIVGKIANLRRIDWTSLSINFVMIFSPGLLESAPQTRIATLRVPTDVEAKAMDELTKQFPNVSALRVKDALAAVGEILAKVAIALRVTAFGTLCAGVLVLAGAIATGNERRGYEGVLLKMLGGTRADVLSGYLWEFALLALVSALLAMALGAIGAYLFLKFRLETALSVDWLEIGAVLVVALALAMAIGFLGSWRALGQRPARYLRNE